MSLNIVYIEWLDPRSIDPWTSIDNIELKLEHIKSYGFLVKENDKSIALALNHDPSEETVSCVTIIPKCLIKRRLNGKVAEQDRKMVDKISPDNNIVTFNPNPS